jgi:hypothetical protein
MIRSFIPIEAELRKENNFFIWYIFIANENGKVHEVIKRQLWSFLTIVVISSITSERSCSDDNYPRCDKLIWSLFLDIIRSDEISFI